MTHEYLQPGNPVFSDPQSTAAWFGGVFEAGATTTLSISEYIDRSGVLRIRTLPYLEIHSHDQSMLVRLYEVYGGQRKERFWGKGGYKAAEIVASTLPFSVARVEHALAMQNWLNAENPEEKIEIAHDLKGIIWQQNSEPESYAKLLKNPAFVAGIFDSRGYMQIRTASSKEDRKDHSQYVHIGSKNNGLLEALKSNFGGRIRVTNPAGTVIDFSGRISKTQVDTNVWEVLSTKAVNFLQFAFPFLQTTLPEDWNYQKSSVKQQNTQQLAEKITDQVRRELVILRESGIAEISTDAMLAESFNVHKATIGRYLRRKLTANEKKKRFSALTTNARSTIDVTTIRGVIAHIQDEVTAFQQGKIDRLSLREELAKKFSISIRILDSRILPHVNPELNSVRRAALGSQTTKARNQSYWQRKKRQN